MKNVAAELKRRGFKPAYPPREGHGDFTVFNDSDGNGEYIRHWFSKEPCPFPELMRAPIDPAVSKEELAKRNADRLEIEAAEQERQDMLKAADIVRESIAQVDAVSAAADEAIKAAELRTHNALMLADAAVKERDRALQSETVAVRKAEIAMEALDIAVARGRDLETANRELAGISDEKDRRIADAEQRVAIASAPLVVQQVKPQGFFSRMFGKR